MSGMVGISFMVTQITILIYALSKLRKYVWNAINYLINSQERSRGEQNRINTLCQLLAVPLDFLKVMITLKNSL